MLYPLLRSLLFRLSPETSHHVALEMLAVTYRLGLSGVLASPLPKCPVKVMGLEFPNPIGLAAGLDKNGAYVDALGAMGFGFIEVGTVTPRSQAGNPQPRLFRLEPQQAIINRMGFNNHGVDHLLDHVARSQYSGILGINIGKNKDTPEDRALEDYVYCLRKVYHRADYITVNVSSPNTPGLRDLQFGDSFTRLLDGLKLEQQKLEKEQGMYRPIVVKVAPDMDQNDIQWMANALLNSGLDGVIATNTTVRRDIIQDSPFCEEIGGLSGAPITEMSTKVIRWFIEELNGRLPVIGVGGIMDAESASEKSAVGADLLQVYTGFIYQGPRLLQAALDGYLDGKKARGQAVAV